MVRLLYLIVVVLTFSSKVIAQDGLMLIYKSGHEKQISSAYLSPDKRYLISVDDNEMAILWDNETGKQLKVYDNIIHAIFSADSKFLEFVTSDYQFIQSDLSGKIIKKYSGPYKGPNKYSRINLSYDNNQHNLMVDGNLFNREKGQIGAVYTFPRFYSSALDAIITGNVGTNELLFYTNGYQNVTKKINTGFANNIPIYLIKASPNGNFLAVINEEKKLNIIDVEKNKVLLNLNVEEIYNVTFSNDSKDIITVHNGFVKRYSLADNKLLWKSTVPELSYAKWKNSDVGDINFSEDGTQVLVTCLTFIARLDSKTGGVELSINGTNNIHRLYNLYLASNNQHLYAKTGSAELVNWNLMSGKMEKPVLLSNQTKFYQISADNKKVFKLEDRNFAKEIDFNSKETGEFQSPLRRQNETKFLLSYDNQYLGLAATNFDCDTCEKRSTTRMEIYDSKSKKLILAKQKVSLFTFANTKNQIATLDYLQRDNHIYFYNLPAANLVDKIPIDGNFIWQNSNFIYSKNDKYLAVPSTKGINIIDLTTKNIRLIDVKQFTKFSINQSAFTPDEKYLLLASTAGEIFFYNIQSNLIESNKTIKAHESVINELNVTADGNHLFSSSTELQIKLWSLKTNELLASLYPNPSTGDWAIITPEGRFDASPKAQEDMYFIKGVEVYPLSLIYEKFYTPRLLPRILLGEKFPPIDFDIKDIKKLPIVEITYKETVRNLEVVDAKQTRFVNTSGKAEIIVNARVENDVIDEVRLFHNGKIVNLATRGLFTTDEVTGRSIKNYTINLLPGMNTFKAIALNSQRSESRPEEIQVLYTETDKNETIVNNDQPNRGKIIIEEIDKSATLHLIVVGINTYKNPKMSLNYALADATAFKNEIENSTKGLIKNIKTYFVTDDNADNIGILNAFNNVKTAASPQDVFVFYYAGHGVISEQNKEFYLVPNNVTDLKNVDQELKNYGISSKKLQEYAVNIQAQKQVFILDACQSAGAFEDLMSKDADQEKNLAVVARSTGTHWMAASGSQQFAQEFSQLGHGAFTYILLNAIKGEAVNNKLITVNGLKDFLQNQFPVLMKKYNGIQQYPVSYGYGNDFPLGIIK